MPSAGPGAPCCCHWRLFPMALAPGNGSWTPAAGVGPQGLVLGLCSCTCMVWGGHPCAFFPPCHPCTGCFLVVPPFVEPVMAQPFLSPVNVYRSDQASLPTCSLPADLSPCTKLGNSLCSKKGICRKHLLLPRLLQVSCGASM